jgi:hypothetical protein
VVPLATGLERKSHEWQLDLSIPKDLCDLHDVLIYLPFQAVVRDKVQRKNASGCHVEKRMPCRIGASSLLAPPFSATCALSCTYVNNLPKIETILIIHSLVATQDIASLRMSLTHKFSIFPNCLSFKANPSITISIRKL